LPDEREVMPATTTSIDTYTATCDGRSVRVEHRDGDDTVLLDVLLLAEPIRAEDELADLLDTYLTGA
jgi:hypothetical protein